MPKVGMQPIRRQQLIEATLQAVDQVGLGDASIALIARLAGVSNGIISHYFQDKNGLIAATMGYIMSMLEGVAARRQALTDDSPRAPEVIIEGNFDASQVNGPAMKTWLAFWATSMHQPSLHRLQRINDHRLYSNLCCQFRRALPLDAQAARGWQPDRRPVVARGALSGDAFDTDQAIRIAYEYMDLQLAKQHSLGTNEKPLNHRARHWPTGRSVTRQPTTHCTCEDTMARFELQKLYIDGAYVDAGSDATSKPSTRPTAKSSPRAARTRKTSSVAVQRRKRPENLGRHDRHAAFAHPARAVDILRERNDELAAGNPGHRQVVPKPLRRHRHRRRRAGILRRPGTGHRRRADPAARIVLVYPAASRWA
jgi:TetR/AcrR family transcriptional repressor of bet genes